MWGDLGTVSQPGAGPKRSQCYGQVSSLRVMLSKCEGYKCCCNGQSDQDLDFVVTLYAGWNLRRSGQGTKGTRYFRLSYCDSLTLSGLYIKNA